MSTGNQPVGTIGIESSVYEPGMEGLEFANVGAALEPQDDCASTKQTPGQKRPRALDEDDESSSDGYSPSANIVPSPRETKRARFKQDQSVCGPEQRDREDSDSDPNPRAALEAGKSVKPSSATTNGDEPQHSSSSPPPAGHLVAASSSSRPDDSMGAEQEVDRTEADDLEPFAGASMPLEPRLYTTDSFSLSLPALSDQKQGSWLARFKDWVQVLCHHNSDGLAAISPAVATDAFVFYLDQHSGLRQSKKKAAKQAARKEATTRAIQNLIESAGSDATVTVPVPGPSAAAMGTGTAEKEKTPETRDDGSAEEGEVTSNGASASGEQPAEVPSCQNGGPSSVVREGVPTGEDELNQQRRYFPSASDPSKMCLLCGGEGHRAIHCTRSKCRFCNSFDHWDFCCPDIRERCGRCRQLGHKAVSCAEKLALTKDEGLACAYCSSPEHLEENCTEVWRSFRADAETIHKVASLQSSCAACGGSDHYSADCRQRRGVCGNPTWSVRNRSIYVDPACDTLSIEATPVPRATQQQPLRDRKSVV